MTRNTVAITSAVVFVVLAALLAVSPVPYVTLSPGGTYNVLGSAAGQPMIRIEGVQTYPAKGGLLVATVAQPQADSQITLPEALIAEFSADSEVLPREWVYRAGKTSEQLQTDATRQLELAQRSATVAALRAAGHPVTEVPMVASVSVAGPAYNALAEGDLITRVNGTAVNTPAQVREIVQSAPVGGEVVFDFIRNKRLLTVQIVTAASNTNRKLSTSGASYATGYQYAPTVTYSSDGAVAGPSGGLALALGIFDLITENDLVGDRTVAAIGTIDPDGGIGRVGGVREKVYAAQRAGVSAFLIPAENCADLEGVEVGFPLVKVATLKDAIAALQLLTEPQPTTEVPHC